MILVHVDVEEQELWLFFPSGQSPSIKPSAGQEAEQYMREICGVSLQCMWPLRVCNRSTNDGTLAGVLTSSISASTLLELPPAAASVPIGPNESLRAVQDINKQIWEANASLGRPTDGKGPNSGMQRSMGDELSWVDLYENFISAVLAMFSYHLARYHDYVPLNSRTFLSAAVVMSTSPNSSGFDKSPEPSRNSTLVTLDVRLTDMGSLIVTLSTVLSGVSRFSRADNRWRQPAGAELRLSPGGQMAKYIGPAVSSTDDLLAESPASSERPGVDVPPKDSRLEDTWKTEVQSWLAGKGIRLPFMTSRDWVEVLITSSQASQNGGSENPSDPLQFLWPRDLCFTHIDTRLNRLDTGINRLQDFDEAVETYDPLSFAENWFKSKLLRDGQIEAARSARKADEVLAQHSRVSENTVLDNNSMDEPYIRVVNYLDLHAAGTIYPTPPDGAHTQGITEAHPNNESGTTPDNGDVGNFDRSESIGANNEHGLARSTQVDEGDDESGERRRSDASQIAMLSAAYDASHVDMFGDIDGDMFGTSGITEADFSFFDEPDLEDAGDQIFDPAGPTTRTDSGSCVDPVAQSASQTVAADFSNIAYSDSATHAKMIGPTFNVTTEACAPKAGDMTSKHVEEQKPALSLDTPDGLTQDTALNPNRVGEETGQFEGEGFPSPPLSPVSVRKRLLPMLEESFMGEQPAVFDKDSEHCNNNANFHDGVFGRVPFARAVDFSDRKYSDDGRFASNLQEDVLYHESRCRKSDIPSIGFPLLTRSHSQGNAVDCISNASSQTEDTALHSDEVSEFDKGKPEGLFETQVATADRDYNVLVEDNSVTSGVKRKRDSSDGENTPMEVVPLEMADQHPTYESEAQIRLPSLSHFVPSASAWPLTHSEARLGRDMRKVVGLSDEDYIRVAQILTDQVVSSSLSCYDLETTLNKWMHHVPKTLGGKEEQAAIGEVVRSIFPTSSLCDLDTYAAIEETTWESPTNVRAVNKRSRGAQTGGDGSGSLGSHIFRLTAPHIRVQRAETPVEVLAPALPFWETLGFSPVNGGKDVRAFCICPPMEGLEDAAESFLEGLGSAYESCKLGTHTRGDYPKGPSPGLVPIVGREVNLSLESTVEKIITVCEELGKTRFHIVGYRLTLV